MSGKQSNQNKIIQAVILAGGQESVFSKATPSLPTALWSIAGQSVLARLLRRLADEGIKQAILCGNNQSEILRKAVNGTAGIELKTIPETMPLGTAGSIRVAAGDRCEEPLLVVQANLVSPPALGQLWKEHRQTRAALTVALNPFSERNGDTEVAGVYLCEPSVLKYIPQKGYCDIKETLIPNLIAAGEKVHAVRLDGPAGNYRKVPDFLTAVADRLESANGIIPEVSNNRKAPREKIYIHPTAQVDPSARIIGPAIIMEKAIVAPDVVLAGPCIVEADCRIGTGSLIAQSILWSGTRVGENCQVRTSVLDRHAIVSSGKVVEDQFLPAKHSFLIPGYLSRLRQKWFEWFDPLAHKVGRSITQKIMPSAKSRQIAVPALQIVLLLAALLWSYRSTFADLWKVWTQSDEYSSGLLVPFLAVYLLWARRDKFKNLPLNPSAWGILIFLAAQIFRYLGLFLMYGSAERLSLIFSVAGIALFILGGVCFRRIITIWLFLFLMLPLPRRVENKITLPLQSGATTSAVFCLELIGYDVRQEGNVIHIGDTMVAVAEACNGLRMVTSFFVVSSLVVLLIQRSLWEKLILLLSTLPIALLCNTIRLAITAIAFTYITGEAWEQVFHDYGGYAMMPLALALVVLELWLLTKLITPPPERDQQAETGVLIPRTGN